MEQAGLNLMRRKAPNEKVSLLQAPRSSDLRPVFAAANVNLVQFRRYRVNVAFFSFLL